MFKENYKKDNEQIIASEELISNTRTKMRTVSTGKVSLKRNFAFKSAVTFATVAAIVCVCMFGNILLNFNNSVTPPTDTAKSGNAFVLTAFAAEEQPDGNIIKKAIEFSQADDASGNSKPEPVLWSIDGENDKYSLAMFKGIAFEYNGTNIENIVFSVDNGYFSKLDNDGGLQRLGMSYEIKKQEFAPESMILWGVDIKGAVITHEEGSDKMSISFADGKPDITIPENITVKAVVTFEDGEVQEKIVVYNTQKGTLILSEKNENR